MKRLQRIVLMVAGIGVFHSSLVPPVKQEGGDLCRYHEFMERGWPYTREFGTAGVDGLALLTEYGILVSLAAIVYLAVGLFGAANASTD